MPNLKIVAIEKNKYTLQDVNEKQTYTLDLTFYGLKNSPKIGDVIGMHNELLDKNYEEYSTNYRFGPLNEPYGRNVKSSDDIDCILLFSGGKETYLKRFFG